MRVAPSPDALQRVGLSRREVPLARGEEVDTGVPDSADSARDDTKTNHKAE